MKYKLLSWDKYNNSIKTGCIVNEDNILIDVIERVFDKYGNYSNDLLDKFKKYDIKGDCISENKDHFLISLFNPTIDEAIMHHIEETKSLDKINLFLTDEKIKRLLDLFKNNDKL